MELPSSWSEVYARFIDRLGGDPEAARRDVDEWFREAVEARWGVKTLHDLDRLGRIVAFQKASGVVLALDELGLPDEVVSADGDIPPLLIYRDGTVELRGDYPGRRGAIADVVARYFDGIVIDGPPWRIYETEPERPTYEEYVASADFG